MTKAEYRDYLQSAHWMFLRSRKIAANPICQKCKTRHAQEVHHIRYRRIFDVTLADLQSLCRTCHRAAHGLTYEPLSPRKAPRKPTPGLSKNKKRKLASADYQARVKQWQQASWQDRIKLQKKWGIR